MRIIMLNLTEFKDLTYCYEKLIDFLIQHGVFASVIKCSRCGTDININKETLTYRCRKRYFVKNVHKKRISKQCYFIQSATSGSWFNKSHLDIAAICKIIACFLMLRHPRKDETQHETGVLESDAIVDLFNFCREVCVIWAEKHSEKLGGPGCIVEIDEAKIGKINYNGGRLITGQWIFGGYEQDTKKIFIAPVQDRTKETLLTTIKEWILPGTTIVSKCWKSYNCINNENFQHLRVNHSYNFVNLESGMLTQNIESVGREVRGDIPRCEMKEYHGYLGYLCEYLFKCAYSRLERIENFFDIIAELYPPMSTLKNHLENHLEDRSEASSEESSSSTT